MPGESNTYFVTGATGFIGRNLVERLLERGGEVHVLVREGSRERLDALIERWGGQGRVHPVTGDLRAPKLGIDPGWIDAHRGKIDHAFHLAAIYDMTAADEINEALNVGGTRELVALANDLQPGILHHVSSVAVAGAHKGFFREDMFDEGQKLPSAYHRTKFESERLVREGAQVPWRVYRPAIVIGDSRTGEMDKVDGPYYFFKAIQRARNALPQWFPLVGPEVGSTNLVPVDYVAAAMDAIAHREGLDGRAFHLADAKMVPSGRGAEPLRQGRPRAAARDADRQQAARRAAQGRAVDGDAAAAAQGRAPRDPRRLQHPRRDRRARRLQLLVRHARHRAGAWRAPASRSRRCRRTPRRSGTTGSATSTRTSSRTARCAPPSTARPS